MKKKKTYYYVYYRVLRKTINFNSDLHRFYYWEKYTPKYRKMNFTDYVQAKNAYLQLCFDLPKPLEKSICEVMLVSTSCGDKKGFLNGLNLRDIRVLNREFVNILCSEAYRGLTFPLSSFRNYVWGVTPENYIEPKTTTIV